MWQQMTMINLSVLRQWKWYPTCDHLLISSCTTATKYHYVGFSNVCSCWNDLEISLFFFQGDLHVDAKPVRILRTGPLHFLARGHKRCTKPGFVLLARAGNFVSAFCVSGVSSVLFPCFRLSVPVQSIAWKD